MYKINLKVTSLYTSLQGVFCIYFFKMGNNQDILNSFKINTAIKYILLQSFQIYTYFKK